MKKYRIGLMTMCVLIIAVTIGLWVFDSLTLYKIGPYGILFSAICTFISLLISGKDGAKQTKEQ